ncbi:MAG: S8 family serine peptidase [Chloroflexaceae bacterium]|nr:S8 family serine peptidase [Chloroflexaceae bacterium]
MERGTFANLIWRSYRCSSLLLLGILCACLAPVGTHADRAPAPEQWALAQIGAACAWQVSRGVGAAGAVTVAVIDSGVDMQHPDLVGQVRHDGYDFVDDDPDPTDTNGHGTHVAGIIGAMGRQAHGVIGVAPAAQILPVRVMNAEGWGTQTQIADGIRYATTKGVQVINLSVGATLWPAEEQRVTDSPITAAVQAALDAGIVVVVAAGNDFVPFPNIIAYTNPDVILVAAADPDNARAPFSNTGPWVDVVAPGQQIRSTMPTYPVYLTSTALPPAERFQPNYDTLSGTSQAAPHVAGVAALLLATDPQLTAADVTDIIRRSANMDIYRQHPAAFRRLHELGAGRLDACAALRQLGAQP